MTAVDTRTLPERMVPVACQLAGRVRERNPHAIRYLISQLTPRERYTLTVVLAAMIPDDRSPGQLLAWVEDDAPPTSGPAAVRALQPCGTHAAFARHQAHDEDPCQRCRNAERVYQQTRAQRRRAVPE